MPTPEETLKAAQEQEAEAKRKAEHQVQDLRELNANVDPDAEAESAGVSKDPVLEAQESQSLEQMTAQEVLDAVDSGEVSKTDALAAEKKRATPRKTVLKGSRGG